MKHEYNQIVRDKIPEIIEKSGRTCDVKILDNDTDIKSALCDKLRVKAESFAARPTEDELSDLYGLMDAIVKAYDFEPMHIDYLKMQNEKQKGAYSGKTYLVSAEDNQ